MQNTTDRDFKGPKRLEVDFSTCMTDAFKYYCMKVKEGDLSLLIYKGANEKTVPEYSGLEMVDQDLYGSKVIPVGADNNDETDHVWHETKMLWHSDRSYSSDVHPVVGLYCQSAPEGSATTLFCDMQQAWRDASTELKEKSNIWCIHDVDKYFQQAQYPHTFKPRMEKIYRKRSKARHPLTMNDKSGTYFFYSPAYTYCDHEEELLEHIIQDKYIYEHHWKDNDLLIYNNLKIIHSRGETASDVKRRHLRYALT
mgnify:FL=1|jgi:alpha-ketoglutarate-dependent taurine dioxygenase|tara:strand:- start:402 stop:1163 length:762 start_codon:yes stop_codon:yes gene_type:complete